MHLGGKVISQFFGVGDGKPLGVVVEIDIDIPLFEPFTDLIRPLFQLLVRITGVPQDLAVMKPDIGKGGRHLFLPGIIRGHRDAQGELMRTEGIVTFLLEPTLVSELKGVPLFRQFIL